LAERTESRGPALPSAQLLRYVRVQPKAGPSRRALARAPLRACPERSEGMTARRSLCREKKGSGRSQFTRAKRSSAGIGDAMAAAAKHDGSGRLAPTSLGPIVVSCEATPAPTPRARSRGDSSRVARPDIVLPFPVWMGRLDCLLMTRTHRIPADIAHSISSAGNAGASGSERKIAD
jgi:hypothetical protein